MPRCGICEEGETKPRSSYENGKLVIEYPKIVKEGEKNVDYNTIEYYQIELDLSNTFTLDVTSNIVLQNVDFYRDFNFGNATNSPNLVQNINNYSFLLVGFEFRRLPFVNATAFNSETLGNISLKIVDIDRINFFSNYPLSQSNNLIYAPIYTKRVIFPIPIEVKKSFDITLELDPNIATSSGTRIDAILTLKVYIVRKDQLDSFKELLKLWGYRYSFKR